MLRNSQKIVTRFAPSPTGLFHVGAARTALFNFLVAQQNKGEMILRIEDTDKKRSEKKYEQDIVNGLRWLGLSWSALYRQSERTEIYKKHLEALLSKGYAYESREEKEGELHTVIRFKNPNTCITFHDEIRGDISFHTEELGDFVIARSLESPLYHLTVVVDDNEMGVTHVVRGEDHISNTPRHILLQQALNMQVPFYAHIPLVLAPDKSKLSKRHGAPSIHEYKEKGYLPQAIVNFLALLGWSPQTISDNLPEVLALDELITYFSIERVQKGGAMFNADKLNWINKEHIKRLSNETILCKVKEFLPGKIKELPFFNDKTLERAIPLLVERIEKFEDISKLCEAGELNYFFEVPEYSAENLSWKEEVAHDTLQNINNIIELLSNIPPSAFQKEGVKEAIWVFAEEQGRGAVLWPFRFALSGRKKSPDPFTLAEILGKDETINRLKTAQEKLKFLKKDGQ